jgi:hypothetical protein
MNQAQLTGERICRQDKWWSPLPVPLWRIADEIAATMSMDVSAMDRVLLQALRTAGPMSYAGLQQMFPHFSKNPIHDALRQLVERRQAVRSGPRGFYVYSAVGGHDAD